MKQTKYTYLLEDSVRIIEVIGTLFDIFCFEVAIVSHEDAVDATGALGANSTPLLGAKDALADQILQEKLFLMNLQCCPE